MSDNRNRHPPLSQITGMAGLLSSRKRLDKAQAEQLGGQFEWVWLRGVAKLLIWKGAGDTFPKAGQSSILVLAPLAYLAK